MSQFFYNKVVLITGGSSGIGKALAKELLSKKAKVCICGRDESKLKTTQLELNHNDLSIFVADIGIEDDCKKFIDFAIAKFKSIDILINNAGISMRALFSDVGIEVLKKSMDINFWGTVYCTKYALPYILKKNGTIVGVSSIAGYTGLPCRTGYSASKFAMQGFLESLRIELLYKNVNVMWVSPGFVASNIRNTALNATGSQQKETPLNEKKLMSAETCAHKILIAIEKRKRTLTMSLQGKLTIWVNRLFPRLADKLVYKHFKNEPDSPLT